MEPHAVDLELSELEIYASGIDRFARCPPAGDLGQAWIPARITDAPHDSAVTERAIEQTLKPFRSCYTRGALHRSADGRAAIVARVRADGADGKRPVIENYATCGLPIEVVDCMVAETARLQVEPPASGTRTVVIPAVFAPRNGYEGAVATAHDTYAAAAHVTMDEARPALHACEQRFRPAVQAQGVFALRLDASGRVLSAKVEPWVGRTISGRAPAGWWRSSSLPDRRREARASSRGSPSIRERANVAGVQQPRVVVIPFGVPPASEGLGLGLAALVHGFVLLGGESVALAQLVTQDRPPKEGHDDRPATKPVETFLHPQAWRDLSLRGEAPPGVQMVMTGTFEPPEGGLPGSIRLLAFDPRDGATHARVEAHLDDRGAGRILLEAFEDLCRPLDGDLGVFRDIGDLEWEALESVLRGERCLVHDAQRGGPYDRRAALVHLERAVEDAPSSRFPAGRLAATAIDAVVNGRDDRLTDAALRTLRRAMDGAPGQIDLLEASAALRVRIGDRAGAERDALAAIAIAPDRARLYGILSEARRSSSDLDGAMAAVDRGLHVCGGADPVLLTEQGIVFELRRDAMAARASFERALAANPPFPGAFAHLANIAAQHRDVLLAESLVDRALGWSSPHPDILRQAIQLAFGAEPEGVARASRVLKLGRMLLDQLPNDPWAHLMLGRALAQMGDPTEALVAFRNAERLAPGTNIAAEAVRERLPLEDPETSLELESVMHGAMTAEPADLLPIAARAQRLADARALWIAHYAVGIARRRMGSWDLARRAFEAALALAPDSPDLCLELVDACIALGEGDEALRQANRARAIAGDGPRTLGALAKAEYARANYASAEIWVLRALIHDRQDAANVRLEAQIRAMNETAAPAPASAAPSASGSSFSPLATLQRLLPKNLLKKLR
ncbi:tetratricopeptide repeat protein [Pendulispora albinea]|uniref:Tetratricopeptide repeat protein n=1 Tax=Pendulispora albinea TaxID=2741071 RepID=A0ABZ2M0W7_9BACT